MTSELGDAEDKYRRKIDEEDDLILTSTDIRDINDQKTVIKTIPLKFNPRISYNGLDDEDEGGNGRGNGKSKVPVDKRILRQMLENWGLKFSKPGRKSKKLYQIVTAENGIDENQEKTIEAMLERQFATGYFEKNRFKIDVRDEDLRYNFVEEKLIPNISATFVIIRDISGSMSEYSEFSATIAGLIEFWLRQRYEDMVKIKYVAHTDEAYEINPAKSEEFFKLKSEGGTAFRPAYQLVLDMMDGKPYNSQNPSRDRIDYEAEDVFLLHITDGENSDNDDLLYNALKRIFPRITKVFYMQIGDTNNSTLTNGAFYNTITSIDKDKISAVKSVNDTSYENVKKVLDKLLN